MQDAARNRRGRRARLDASCACHEHLLSVRQAHSLPRSGTECITHPPIPFPGLRNRHITRASLPRSRPALPFPRRGAGPVRVARRSARKEDAVRLTRRSFLRGSGMMMGTALGGRAARLVAQPRDALRPGPRAAERPPPSRRPG
jgi:hypothetical protein